MSNAFPQPAAVPPVVALFRQDGGGRSADRRLRGAPPLRFIDPVTGLLNRAGLEDAVGAMLESAAAAVAPRAVGALLCVDLGGPEALARYGAGREGAARDALLHDVADALRTAVRGVDAVGRLGCDDFVIVLESLGDLANASRVADTVMCVLRRVRVAGGGLEPRIGVTRLPQTPRAVASMFAAREQAVGAA